VREIVSEVKREDLPWQSQRREDRPEQPVMPAKEMQQKFTAEFFATEARPVEVKGDYAKIMTPVYEEIQLRQGQKEGSGEIRVRLVPDSLGEVVIHLSRQDGRITGRVTVENAFVRDAIEANLSQLRQRLAQQEITLSELNVFVGNESREWGSRRGANALRRQNAPVVMPAVADVATRNPTGIPTGKLDVLA
jgi:flagellar hook-length control protein FliK